jgi:2,4-dienoyl-CoA reductase-like NADH-dependent reductase (Old Yellow Enzyme family)
LGEGRGGGFLGGDDILDCERDAAGDGGIPTLGRTVFHRASAAAGEQEHAHRRRKQWPPEFRSNSVVPAHGSGYGGAMSALASPLALACGVTIPNRLAKAAMTEGLADARNRATPEHATLYRRWADGGLGLSITGNVQICRRHLERAGNVVLDGPPDAVQLIQLQAFARAASAGGTVAIVQLSHAGRQTPAAINAAPEAPSAVALALPGRQFGRLVAMAQAAIEALPERFAEAALASCSAGFAGVQLHAAHGYLLSSFLSPLANQRTDRWGGSLANRARLLVEAVRAVRAAIGPAAIVAVKLNSADFQRGGFAVEESAEVAAMLEAERVDFIEVSGGNYEAPRMVGLDGLADADSASARTAAREAYFLKEAERLRRATSLPLMLTGGFRTLAAMQAAVATGAADLIGLARPLILAPDAPRQLVSGAMASLPSPERILSLGPGPLSRGAPHPLVRMLNGLGIQAWFYQQILRLGRGQDPDPAMPLWLALLRHQARETSMARALA